MALGHSDLHISCLRGFYLTRKTFTICKTTIAKDLNWQLGDTAQIWTVFLVAYMLGMFINSFIGRRWGPRVLLLGGLGLSLAFNVVFGLARLLPPLEGLKSF